MNKKTLVKFFKCELTIFCVHGVSTAIVGIGKDFNMSQSRPRPILDDQVDVRGTYMRIMTNKKSRVSPLFILCVPLDT